MAATTLPLHDNTDRWQEPAHRDQQKVLAGNRVKSKPAKDAVISGILSSLETLESPRPGVQPNTFYIEDSRHNSLQRPFSPAQSLAGAPDVPFSQHVHASIAAVESDDEFDDSFAAAPIVPTIRTTSGPPPVLRSSSYSQASPIPSGSDSKGALVNGTQKERIPDKSHAEALNKSTGSPSPRRLRRVSSRDTLRQDDTLRQVRPDKDFQVDQDFILNGLGSLAATPGSGRPRTPQRSPKLLGKARLYLHESMEDMKLDRDADSIRSGSSSAGPSTPATRPSRATRPSPITDSIPLRTSSLRQASNSPASSRRILKPQRGARAPSLQRTISEDNEDAQWASLGEHDETVKRIMELRKKRETRLLDEDLSLIVDTIDTRTAAAGTSSYRETSSPERQRRPLTSASETPSAKAKQILGIDSGYTPHFNSSNGAGNSDGANTAARALCNAKPILGSSLRTPAAAAASHRPVTAKSTASIDPLLSLDYSYAQAVDALQSAEQETERNGLNGEKPQGMTTVALRPTVHRRTTSTSSNNASPLRLKKQRGKYQDVAEELGLSGRRKSMSDARDGEPERRDSVEETVLDYLRAQRLSQKLKHPQSGRIISFSEVGDPKGAAVLVCIGMGLTRFVTAFFDELATTLRLRLITIERPGVGESSPYTDRSGPLMWPGDVTAVFEHLGITKFSMLAHSAGAVYALATALILPNMVRGSIHLLAPWIPPSQLEAAPYDTENTTPGGALPRGQRFLRVLPAPMLKAANSSWLNMGSLQPAKRKSSSPNGASQFSRGRMSSDSPNGVPKRPVTSHGPRPENPRRESMMLMDQFMPETNPMENFPLNEPEKKRSSLFLSATATPSDPNFTYASTALNAAEHAARERQSDFSSRLTQRTWEYAIKDSNPATDLIICLERHREVGFRYTDVKRRIVITHGSEDKRVPIGNVKWLAEQINRAALSRNLGTKESLAYDPGTEPGCEVRILNDEGHGLMASPVIMADILTEIAGYWTAEERGRGS